ncbi:MAG: hypothetical protein PHU97_00060 [Bacteroidales bacterium]|nr:gliding motility lipoprotein GldH [Bacteroidales bacterium]MDD2322394.1 hypothetical protein [Bacteroidales bacterium]MDD3009697.1 hypothetical protein [Bacteroidales bacterium]MDD3960796.1 hypothetical protein [Bacteroidales bacterium]MDY0285235.1 hypothetical protein [Bacteroidales bacterium]
MGKTVLTIVLMALALISCNRGPIYEHYITFEEGIWDRFTTLDFDISIEKAGQPYDIIMVLEYAITFPEDKIPFHIIMTTAGGEERINEYHPRIRSHKGMLYGEVSDGKAVQEVMLRRAHPFTEAGKVTINVECFYPRSPIEGIYKLGIVVRESEKE